jgi:hypothetical protein
MEHMPQVTERKLQDGKNVDFFPMTAVDNLRDMIVQEKESANMERSS